VVPLVKPGGHPSSTVIVVAVAPLAAAVIVTRGV